MLTDAQWLTIFLPATRQSIQPSVYVSAYRLMTFTTILSMKTLSKFAAYRG